MGSRGPKPTPTKVLKLRGSWLATTRHGEPQPTVELPPCPAWLDPLSKSLFRTLAKQLVELGILTRIDRQALARYCVLSIRWRKMEQFIQSHGEVCAIYSEPDEDGQRVLLKIDLYPQVRLASTLATELLRIENHFGLTPSARTALQVEKAPHADHDQKAKFFRQA
jgi:P27 family predicted phage terminase small subunit